MRITRDTLLKIARDTAAQRVRVSRRVRCIYLTGSCLSEEPLLGGCADIDLVIVEDGAPLQAREVVRLNDEVSLDISHYAQEDFQQPRHLRVDPWLGPILYNKPMVLHDSNHWFDYIQASTGAQFLQPDNVLARGRKLAEMARQSWLELSMGGMSDPARQIYAFYKALENAGNAFASLTGIPLTERRFMLNLNQRATAIQQIDLCTALMHLATGDAEVTDEDWQGWLSQWEAALAAAGAMETNPIRLAPARQHYYTRSAAALWNEHPTAAFWIMARTWSQSAAHLPEESPHRASFAQLCQKVGLDEAGFEKRLEELDRALDRVEETLDIWARKNGVVAAQS
jgi:hypothetical protein